MEWPFNFNPLPEIGKSDAFRKAADELGWPTIELRLPSPINLEEDCTGVPIWPSPK